MQRSSIRSKVKEIVPRRPTSRKGRKWSSSLNQKLRKLVQKLGEAIHESVSESENIAGVVQDIRKQGFDVLLMLEATIGLNEVEQQPAAALESSNAENQEGTFTAQDLNFLKSLRIAVESEKTPE